MTLSLVIEPRPHWWEASVLITTPQTAFIMVIEFNTFFVSVLISFSNLAAMGKIQKNICTKVRPVGLININKKE